MDPGYENLIEYISEQLSPDNLAEIIQESLKAAIPKLIDDYIKSQFTDLIRDLIKKNIDSVLVQIEDIVNETKQLLKQKSDFINKSTDSQSQSPNTDKLLESLNTKKFNQAFEYFLNLKDVSHQEYYASCFNLEEFNESNLEQKNAVSMAIWAISRRSKELLIKMISIIRKGEGLSSVLREIVRTNDAGLGDVRAIVIKKNI